MIDRYVEPVDGIIQVVSIGEASRAEIDTHYDELRRLIRSIRADGKPIRVLSDQTRAVRLSDELNFHIRDQIQCTYQPGDRVALLMATPDDKLYVRDVLGVAEYATFNSRIAAEMWLMEPSLKPPSA